VIEEGEGRKEKGKGRRDYLKFDFLISPARGDLSVAPGEKGSRIRPGSVGAAH
jgi:hypothetical protein